MKKRILILLALFIFVSTLSGTYRWKGNFLATAEDVGLGATATDGTEFNSSEIWVAKQGWPDICSITVTFTRAAGSASTVDFAFEASFDGGFTWATFEGVTISVAISSHSLWQNEVRILYRPGKISLGNFQRIPII